jgi:CheY-like chemotaxis protein
VTRILIVEDEPDIRDAIAEALADEGYFVECAGEGAAALEQIHTLPPALAIVDLMMPGMDGYGFVRECRADPRRAGMKIIILTASRSTQLASMPADAIVAKPFDLNELIDMIMRFAPL